MSSSRMLRPARSCSFSSSVSFGIQFPFFSIRETGRNDPDEIVCLVGVDDGNDECSIHLAYGMPAFLASFDAILHENVLRIFEHANSERKRDFMLAAVDLVLGFVPLEFDHLFSRLSPRRSVQIGHDVVRPSLRLPLLRGGFLRSARRSTPSK